MDSISYMNNNANISIKPIMNGFLVTYNYRVRSTPEDASPYGAYDYMSDEWTFSSWTDVSTWLNNNPLTFPPTKI